MALPDNLLPEKISLAGIARVTDVSEKWLREYASKKFDEIPKKTEVTEKKKGRLTIECDEMRSYVGNKDNKIWIWLAKDVGTKEIAGCYLGNRDRIGDPPTRSLKFLI